MFDFLQRFFGRPSSSATAKERLRLVLLSDHLSLAPDVVEALKHDLIEVISRYCDVDAEHCDVSFEQQDTRVAMLANIPIVAMHSRPKPAPFTAPPQPAYVPSAAEPVAASVAVADPPVAAAAETVETPLPAPAAPARPARKRKRRRANAAHAANNGDAVPGTAGLSSV